MTHVVWQLSYLLRPLPPNFGPLFDRTSLSEPSVGMCHFSVSAFICELLLRSQGQAQGSCISQHTTKPEEDRFFLLESEIVTQTIVGFGIFAWTEVTNLELCGNSLLSGPGTQETALHKDDIQQQREEGHVLGTAYQLQGCLCSNLKLCSSPDMPKSLLLCLRLHLASFT